MTVTEEAGGRLRPELPSSMTRQPEEVLHDPRSLGSEDALGMELDAEPRRFPVLGRHHETVVRPGRELELGGQVVALDDERVVTPGLERAGQSVENALAVVIDE